MDKGEENGSPFMNTKSRALSEVQCNAMQDVVTREGKLLYLYKRPGQRVIVDAKGRLIVRPTHIEASVQRDTAGSCNVLCRGVRHVVHPTACEALFVMC